MNNPSVESELIICKNELDQIHSLIASLGLTSAIPAYLSRYAVIRGCGAIEIAFKSLVADRVSRRGNVQVKRFLRKRIREGSANPSFDNMCKFLVDFDEQWNSEFKNLVRMNPNKPELLASLESLVAARNDFAHGGSPSVSITDVLRYFDDARRVLEMLDLVIG
jgi:hypothetical protein